MLQIIIHYLWEEKKYLLIRIGGTSDNTYKITHKLIIFIIVGIVGAVLLIALFCTIKICIQKRSLKKKCKVVDQPLVPDNQTLVNDNNSQISNPTNTPKSSPEIYSTKSTTKYSIIYIY